MEKIRDRFKGADWFPIEENITIGGAGGIGSWFTLFAAKADVKNIIVHDYDNVEEHNMGGGFFSKNNIRWSKPIAIQNNCIEYANKRIYAHITDVRENVMTSPIMISAFDNMEARKIFFEKWKDKSSKELFIDGRLEAEQYQIFCVTPENIERYEESLFEDDEISNDRACSYQQTSHNAAMIAGNMFGFLTNYLTNKHLDRKIRSLPFKYEFAIPSSFQNIEL